MADTDLTKTCTKCGETKPISEFYRNKSGQHFYLHSQCKVCKRAETSARRKANPAYMIAYNKAYIETHREEKLLYNHAYYKAHREQIIAQNTAWQKDNDAYTAKKKASSKIWRKNNSQRVVGYSQKWQKAHPEQVKEAARKRRHAHPEINRANVKKHRAKKQHAPINDLTLAEWEMIKQHYDHRCIYCGRKMKKLTQDHITPLSKGGNHTLSNIVPSCQSCNSKKSTGAVLIPIQPLLL